MLGELDSSFQRERMHYSRGRVYLGLSSSILTDGYNFVCSAQTKLCHFNKLSCIHCNDNMM